MKTTNVTVIIAALLLGGRLAWGQALQEATNASMSAAELMRLLPAGPDMDSPSDIKQWKNLKAHGEALIPVIADAIQHSTNTMEIGRLVGLALEIPGDHSKFRPRLHTLLDGDEKANC